MNLQYLCAEEQDIPVIFDQAKALIDAYEDLSAIDYDKVISWVYQKIQGNISGYTCVLLDGVKSHSSLH